MSLHQDHAHPCADIAISATRAGHAHQLLGLLAFLGDHVDHDEARQVIRAAFEEAAADLPAVVIALNALRGGGD